MPQYRTEPAGSFSSTQGMPPHAGQPIARAGADPSTARLLAVLVHGRGAGAEGILPLADELDTRDIVFIAPEASGRAWYPFSFLSPVETNEPGLSSGLSVLRGILDEADRAGFTPDRIALIGFSQGACLALEFAARHPRRFHSVIGFSGGVIGPPGSQRHYSGSMNGTPVFLGCSDRDMHIPAQRVRETADVFQGLGASVDMRLYPGMPHTINDDEITTARAILSDKHPA